MYGPHRTISRHSTHFTLVESDKETRIHGDSTFAENV